MKTTTKIFALLLVLIMVACTSNKVDESLDKVVTTNCDLAAPPPVIESVKFTAPVAKDDAVENNGEEANYSTNEVWGSGIKVDKKKIIKDGTLNIKTKDIALAKKNFDAALKKLNAYYETEDFEKNSTQWAYTLKIRIPSVNFEKMITEVESGKDEIISKSINARDVTEEYVDIETRLTNKREYLKKYKEILARASTIKDILEIQENIRVLQEEIESKEGRLKYLNDQVAYSTLDVTLFKEIAYVYKPQEPDSFKERIKSALNGGWMAIVDFALWLIKVWPQLLVALVLFLIVRKIYKKRKANR